jgi:hypothetical protein
MKARFDKMHENSPILSAVAVALIPPFPSQRPKKTRGFLRKGLDAQGTITP